MQRDDNKGGKTMRITKRRLRRIIKEELSRMRLISEADAQPSLEEIQKMIDKKKEHIQTLEGYRGMDPSIEDQIDIEIKAKSDLIALYKKIRDGQ